VTGESVISWPDEHRPEVSAFHAVNELQIPAEPEVVWAWLCRPDLWPRYYSNARLIRHLEGPWPQVELGSRWRWLSFGAFVTSEVVEYQPEQRLAWSAKELGGSGHHGWVLRPQAGGTFVRTEETQRGLGIRLVKPALRPLMVRFHQRWLEGLSRVASQGPPPAPQSGPAGAAH
jgi:uncharacterized protein YndB with AHSA1/START domain